MPYIKKVIRDSLLKDTRWVIPTSAGELNYMITLLIHDYLRENGNNYQAMNDIIGALDGCKMEFYRRKVAPYEDIKIQENGDV